MNTVKERLPNGRVLKIVYTGSVILYSRYSVLDFEIDIENAPYLISFQFDDDSGSSLTSSVIEDTENRFLKYILHKWNSPPYVEVSAPVEISINGTNNKYFMKFRYTGSNDSPQRKFDLTVWQEDGK